MTKLEYLDRHRFVASAGIALIALSGVIPWLYLREPFDLLVEQEKLAHLSQTAQVILVQRQSLIAAFTTGLPFISGALFIVGVVLLIAGLKSWGVKQGIQDRAEAITLQQLERDARPMSEAEIKEKRDQEMLEVKPEPKAPSTEFNSDGTPKRILNSLSSDSRESPFAKYEAVEKKVIDKLKFAMPEKFELLSRRRIAGREFDAVLARKQSKYPDVLVEIKYLTRKPTKDFFYRMHDRMVSTRLAYRQATGRAARGLNIVVAPNDEIKKQARDLWFAPMTELLKKKTDPNTYVITESEIDDSEYWEMILGDPQINANEWSEDLPGLDSR